MLLTVGRASVNVHGVCVCAGEQGEREGVDGSVTGHYALCAEWLNVDNPHTRSLPPLVPSSILRCIKGRPDVL